MEVAFGNLLTGGGYLNVTALLLEKPIPLDLRCDEPIWGRGTLLESISVAVRRCKALKKLMAVAHACLPCFAALKPDASGEPSADLTHNTGLGAIRLCHLRRSEEVQNGRFEG
jgi:hypothetical protein